MVRAAAILLVIVAAASLCPSGCGRAGWASWTQTPRLRGMHEETFQVHRVLDGGVFVVRYRGEYQQVAIAGVRAPSLLEPGGAEARLKLAKLIGGKQVKIEFPDGVRYDEEGRPRAKVSVNEQDVASALITVVRQGGGAAPAGKGGG